MSQQAQMLVKCYLEACGQDIGLQGTDMIKNPLQYKKIANMQISPSVITNCKWRNCTNENSIKRYTAFSPEAKPEEATEPIIKMKSTGNIIQQNKLKMIAQNLGVVYEDDFITDEHIKTHSAARKRSNERSKSKKKYYPYPRPIKFKGKKDFVQKLKQENKGDTSRVILDQNIEKKMRKKITYGQTKTSRNQMCGEYIK